MSKLIIYTKREVYEKILTHYGVAAQKEKTIEELNELIEAISTKTRKDIVEEIADVENMLEQLKIIYAIKEYEVTLEKSSKNQRTLERIKKEI